MTYLAEQSELLQELRIKVAFRRDEELMLGNVDDVLLDPDCFGALGSRLHELMVAGRKSG